MVKVAKDCSSTNIILIFCCKILTKILVGIPWQLNGQDSVLQLQENQEMGICFLGWEDSLEEGMATHTSILAWSIPWTEEPSMLLSAGSHRIGHDWSWTHHLNHLHPSPSHIEKYLGRLSIKANLFYISSLQKGFLCVRYLMLPQ